MGAGSSLKRHEGGGVIRASGLPQQNTAAAAVEEEDASKVSETLTVKHEAFKSSMDNVDEELECQVLESPPKRVSPTPPKSRKPSTTSTASSDKLPKKAVFTAPSKLRINASHSSLSGAQIARTPTPAPTPSPTKSPHKIFTFSADGEGRRPSKAALSRANSLHSPNLFTASNPLQQRLSEAEALLSKKSEENNHLRNEIKMQQTAVAKIRAERDAAASALQDALERCKSIEMEKDRVLSAFDAFRDGKEAELSALLRTKEELESRLRHTAQWRCAKCFSNRHPGIADDILLPSTMGHAPHKTLFRHHGDTANQHSESSPPTSTTLTQESDNVQGNVLACMELKIYISASSTMKEEADLLVQQCSPLRRWCAGEGYQLTLVNSCSATGSPPQLQRSSSSTSPMDNVSTVIRQEAEHCHIYISFLGDELHKFAREEIDGCMSAEASTRLCLFCFRDALTEDGQPVPGQAPTKSAIATARTRVFSPVGTKNSRAALERMITSSSRGKIISGCSAEGRTAAAFQQVDQCLQQILGRRRERSFAETDLDTSVREIDADMDQRLETHRRRHNALQADTLNRFSSYPLLPALEKFIYRMDEHVSNAGPLPPLLILGDHGCGKTTLLAHWIANHQRSHRTQHILYHFVTSSSSVTADVGGMTRRFVCHLMNWLGVKDYSNVDLCQDDEFPTLLDQVSSRQANAIVLVLDGLERVEDLSQLPWLLEPLPVETRVIVSCSTHQCPLKWRPWPTLLIDEKLTSLHTKPVLRYFLGPAHKLLVPDQEVLLCSESRRTTSNPLFAAVVSRHLASDSNPSTLAARIKTALDCKSIHELLLLVFSRLNSLVVVSEETLKKVLCYIHVSRDGIAQSDLIELCKLTWLNWMRLRQVLLHHLLIVHQSGLISISGPTVAVVVKKLFLESPDATSSYRTLYIAQLVSKFRASFRGSHLCEELMFQFNYHCDHPTIESFLLDPDVLLHIFVSGNCSVLLELWMKTSKEADDIASLYTRMAPESGNGSNVQLYSLSVIQEVLASFLIKYLHAPSKSISLARRCLAIREEILDPDHPAVARALHCLADVHMKNDQLDIAVQLLQQATGITKDSVGATSRQMADHLCLLGMIAKNQDRLDEAEQFQLRAISTLQELAKKTRSMVSMQDPFREHLANGSSGSNAPNVSMETQRDLESLNQCAMLHLVQGDCKVAEGLFSRLLQGQRNLYGEVHAEVAQTLHNFGTLYADLGMFDEAHAVLQKCLSIRVKLFDGSNKSVLTTMNLIAALHRRQGIYQKALPYYKRALAEEEKCFGDMHLNVASATSNLAVTLYHLSDFETAMSLHSRALGIYTNTLGGGHPTTLESQLCLRLCREKPLRLLVHAALSHADSFLGDEDAG